MSYFPRAARVLVVLVLAGSATAFPPAAVAAMQQRLRQNKRLPKRAAIVFDKLWSNPFESRVIFRAWARAGPKGKKEWVRIEQAVWRAGSGLSAPLLGLALTRSAVASDGAPRVPPGPSAAG